jgi:hypothetical protein
MRQVLFGIGLAALIAQLALPAEAGLIASPPNTVNALFFLGAHDDASKETEDFGSPPMVGPAPIGAGGVDFLQGASSGSTIHVGDTQITITNLLSLPFCVGSETPCTDSFTGFEFQFSSGVQITGVSVDASSAPDFQPNSTAPHQGLQLLSPTDILVDVTGAAPAVNDTLVLDLSFASTPPPGVPEPGSLALLVSALTGFGAVSLRRRGAL